jgi:Carboxypeptidase regulatory-like domain/TonB-dependent Receptor Plug Domain
MKTIVCILSLLAVAAYLNAQTTTGGISGTVSDSVGAAVPSARVTITKTDTNEVRTTSTDASGSFEFTAVPPGLYAVQVSQPGFKEAIQKIELRVQQFAKLDFALQVGQATEQVVVSSQVQLLDAETSSLGQVVENQEVTQLPLNGRNALTFVELTPGVRIQNLFGANLATTNWTGWGNFSINGGLSNSNEVLVDGAPVTMAELNDVVYIPPVDATQEFRIQTDNYSAEFGRSSGGVVNISIKNGSNDFHGNLYEFLRNRSLDANDYFLNGAGQPRPALTYNQFGGTIGGPIIKDKTFFFINIESFRQRQGMALTATVPTPAQRAGDFSQTFNSGGSLISIADPLTTTQNPDGTYSRQLFAGNVIPATRINPVAMNIMNALWPLPNAAGQTFTNVNNFVTSASVPSDSDQGLIRIDQNFGQKWKLYGTYADQSYNPGIFDPFHNNTTTSDLGADIKKIHYVVISATALFSPTFIGEAHTSFLRFNLDRRPPSLGYDLTSLGFPQSMVSQLQFKTFPTIQVAGIQALSNTTSSVIPRTSNNWSESGSLTWIKANHTVKTGAQYRVLQLNDLQNNTPTPQFNFDGTFTSSTPLATTPTSGVGFATFLLGYPNSSSAVSTVDALATQRWYWAFFVQDDWKLKKNLVLNLGIQYSLDSSTTERHNRQAWFNPTATTSLPGVSLPLVGGLEFATPSQRTPVDLEKNQWGPRLGFAYSWRPKTVLRGGYGIYWLPNNLETPNTGQGAPAWSVTTPFVSSLNGGITPFNDLSNPYPNGLLVPPGSAQGLNTLVGQSIGVLERNAKGAGYMQSWFFNVQQELTHDFTIDLAYAGTKGTHLPLDFGLNQLPDQYLALGSALNDQVPNPFYGAVTTGTLAQPTVSRGQLLLPYPQFTGVTVDADPLGYSNYNSMQLKVTKRFSHSLLSAIYVISKSLGDSEERAAWNDTGQYGYMDNYRPQLDYSLAAFDAPQRFVLQYNLDLPFGHGQTYLADTGKLDRLVSGWEVTGIYTAQSGIPIGFTTATNNTNSYGGGSRPNVVPGCKKAASGSTRERLNEWFNTACFTQPPPFTFGNESRNDPTLRSAGINDLDAGFFKNNFFGHDDRFNLQFRSEFFNLFNRVQFAPPDAVLGDPQFGVVSAAANNPRLIQFALKLVF